MAHSTPPMRAVMNWFTPNMVLTVATCFSLSTPPKRGSSTNCNPPAITATLAAAPKSNSAYLAIAAAQKNVREGNLLEVPSHLRNDGEGYVYPHDSPAHWTPQAYLPEVRRFYFPGRLGAEQRIEERFKRLWKRFSSEDETEKKS